MALAAQNPEPPDAASRRAVKPVTVYSLDRLPPFDRTFYETVRSDLTLAQALTVPPRDARAFEVPAGHLFRIVTPEGSQVGDLNLWNAADLRERFYSGKTRALHATHVSTGDRLWSTLPWLRPMATITHDTLAWYGIDAFGAGVHDVIGTRCDPYTNFLLTGGDYHHCCHSNLTRTLAAARNLPLAEAETHVHDVVNVFMCTGYSRDTNQYVMKASPARAGDFIELFAEIDLLGRTVELSGRRLRQRPLQRRRDVPPAARRNPPPAGGAPGELAAVGAQRLRRPPRGRVRGFWPIGNCILTRLDVS